MAHRILGNYSAAREGSYFKVEQEADLRAHRDRLARDGKLDGRDPRLEAGSRRPSPADTARSEAAFETLPEVLQQSARVTSDKATEARAWARTWDVRIKARAPDPPEWAVRQARRQARQGALNHVGHIPSVRFGGARWGFQDGYGGVGYGAWQRKDWSEKEDAWWDPQGEEGNPAGVAAGYRERLRRSRERAAASEGATGGDEGRLSESDPRARGSAGSAGAGAWSPSLAAPSALAGGVAAAAAGGGRGQAPRYWSVPAHVRPPPAAFREASARTFFAAARSLAYGTALCLLGAAAAAAAGGHLLREAGGVEAVRARAREAAGPLADRLRARLEPIGAALAPDGAGTGEAQGMGAPGDVALERAGRSPSAPSPISELRLKLAARYNKSAISKDWEELKRRE